MSQAAPAALPGDDDTMSARYYRSPVATRGICSMLLFTWLLEVRRPQRFLACRVCTILCMCVCVSVCRLLPCPALPIAAWHAI